MAGNSKCPQGEYTQLVLGNPHMVRAVNIRQTRRWYGSKLLKMKTHREITKTTKKSKGTTCCYLLPRENSQKAAVIRKTLGQRRNAEKGSG